MRGEAEEAIGPRRWGWRLGLPAGLVAVIAILVGAFLVPFGGREINLILITIDTLRADHLGAYGYYRQTSPNIDQLARAGTLFEEARVQWPKTNASVASMLTSTYGTSNRVRAAAAMLDRRLVTLAEMLDPAGYYCASFVANAHLGKSFRFDQGFAEVHEMWASRWIVHSTTINSAPFANQRIAREVRAWIERNREKKFFLWVHFLDPHGPYKPPDERYAPFVGDRIHKSQAVVPPESAIPWWIKDDSSQTLGDYVAKYDGEVASTDAAVGELLAELEIQGLADSSLVVLTADHGESLGEHDYYFQHGSFLYDASSKVPLIVRLPGRVAAARRVEAQVGLIDLVPTILELIGVKADPYLGQIEGRSFARLLSAGENYQPRPVFAEAIHKQLSVVNGKWKLIQSPSGSGYQLFDLAADPGEERNLVEERPEEVAKLVKLVSRWRQSLRDRASYQSAPVVAEKLDEGVRRQLQSLGYLGGGKNGTPGEHADDRR